MNWCVSLHIQPPIISKLVPQKAFKLYENDAKVGQAMSSSGRFGLPHNERTFRPKSWLEMCPTFMGSTSSFENPAFLVGCIPHDWMRPAGTGSQKHLARKRQIIFSGDAKNPPIDWLHISHDSVLYTMIYDNYNIWEYMGYHDYIMIIPLYNHIESWDIQIICHCIPWFYIYSIYQYIYIYVYIYISPSCPSLSSRHNTPQGGSRHGHSFRQMLSTLAARRRTRL